MEPTQPQADKPTPPTEPLDDESRIVQAMHRRLTQLANQTTGTEAQRYAAAAAKFAPKPTPAPSDPAP